LGTKFTLTAPCINLIYNYVLFSGDME
jgi:hypothetical protein